jgi:hypothetical protein
MATGGDIPEKLPQGWFADPFGVHDARWFSQGTPTALVRDGRTESQDPPAEATWTGRLVPAPVAPGPAVVPGPEIVGRRTDERDPDAEPGSRFGFLGDPLPPGTVGAPAAAQARAGRGVIAVTGGLPPPTPKRLVAYRWIALGLAVGWTLLVAGLILSATTTTRTSSGVTGPTDMLSSDPVGVVLFLLFLLACCAVAGVGLYRRVRADSEASGRAGYVVAGVLFVLGVLSLASIGLTLIILAFALWVVARPIRRPRPLPGDRVV